MANHVTNIIKVIGNDEDIQELKTFIKPTRELPKGEEENTIIDFERIIPMPADLKIESGSSTDNGIAVIMFRERGVASKLAEQLNWPWVKAEGITTVEALADYLVKKDRANLVNGRKAVENMDKYGSKDWYDWSCKHWGTKWGAYSQMESDDTIEFSTAWSAPIPVIKELSRLFPKVKIKLRFADEDFGSNCGEITFSKGTIIKQNIPESGSPEAYLLAGDVQGMELDSYFDYIGQAEDEEYVFNVLTALRCKHEMSKIVESAITSDNVTVEFLLLIKKFLLGIEAFELIPAVDIRINELILEAEEDNR